MKFILSLLLAVFALFADSAAAAPLRCSLRMKSEPLSARSKVYRFVEDAAQFHYYGRLDWEKVRPISDVVVQQRCINASRSFEGITVRFVAQVRKGPRGKVVPFHCYTRMKRMLGFTTARDKWGPWLDVGTVCRRSPRFHLDELPEFRRDRDDDGELPTRSFRDAESPDDVFDPDFSSRGSSWGETDLGDPVDGPSAGEEEAWPYFGG